MITPLDMFIYLQKLTQNVSPQFMYIQTLNSVVKVLCVYYQNLGLGLLLICQCFKTDPTNVDLTIIYFIIGKENCFCSSWSLIILTGCNTILRSIIHDIQLAGLWLHVVGVPGGWLLLQEFLSRTWSHKEPLLMVTKEDSFSLQFFSSKVILRGGSLDGA